MMDREGGFICGVTRFGLLMSWVSAEAFVWGVDDVREIDRLID